MWYFNQWTLNAEILEQKTWSTEDVGKKHAPFSEKDSGSRFNYQQKGESKVKILTQGVRIKMEPNGPNSLHAMIFSVLTKILKVSNPWEVRNCQNANWPLIRVLSFQQFLTSNWFETFRILISTLKILSCKISEKLVHWVPF